MRAERGAGCDTAAGGASRPATISPAATAILHGVRESTVDDLPPRRGRRQLQTARGRRNAYIMRPRRPMAEFFYLTDEQRMIRDLARKIARERIAPHAAHYDETETYPEESIKAIVEAGLYAIWVPEAYGGNDLGCLALSLVTEEIARACAATATQFLDQPLGGLPIRLAGSEAQKKKYLPGLATGELPAAYS